VSPPSTKLTRRPGASGMKSTVRWLLAVSPRTRLIRTVTRRGGITAWASNAIALSTIVTSSLARVSPAANSRRTVISTQRGGHDAARQELRVGAGGRGLDDAEAISHAVVRRLQRRHQQGGRGDREATAPRTSHASPRAGPRPVHPSASVPATPRPPRPREQAR